MGSKNRIAKHILPIMLKEAEVRGINTWIEPFVGGGNMIDKVPSSYERIGYDINPHVIMALIDIRDNIDKLPDSVSEEEYKSYRGLPPQTITSWVRFVCSFGGKFDNGYAREKRSNEKTFVGYGKNNAKKQQKGFRNDCQESLDNSLKQYPKIQKVEFICDTYENLKFKNSLIYCDPPYQNTTSYKTETFNHDKFWDWCREMSKDNLVFVSEYNAPSDFNCIWQGEVKTNFASQRNKPTHNAVEKLFVHNSTKLSSYKKRTLF